MYQNKRESECDKLFHKINMSYHLIGSNILFQRAEAKASCANK